MSSHHHPYKKLIILHNSIIDDESVNYFWVPFPHPLCLMNDGKIFFLWKSRRYKTRNTKHMIKYFKYFMHILFIHTHTLCCIVAYFPLLIFQPNPCAAKNKLTHTHTKLAVQQYRCASFYTSISIKNCNLMQMWFSPRFSNVFIAIVVVVVVVVIVYLKKK